MCILKLTEVLKKTFRLICRGQDEAHVRITDSNNDIHSKTAEKEQSKDYMQFRVEEMREKSKHGTKYVKLE
jgi:hypothetical protein